MSEDNAMLMARPEARCVSHQCLENAESCATDNCRQSPAAPVPLIISKAYSMPAAVPAATICALGVQCLWPNDMQHCN